MKGHRAQTECLNVSLALSVTSTQLVLSSSSKTMWEAHLELHRWKGSSIKKGISEERGLVCREVMSKSVLHVINYQSWASQERLCKYFFCSTKEIYLFDPPCCPTKAAMLEDNWANDGSAFNLPSKLYIPLQIFQIQLPFGSISLDKPHVAEAIYNAEGGATISVNFDMY